MHCLTEQQLTSFHSFNSTVPGRSEPAPLPCGSVFVEFPGSQGQPICIMMQDEFNTPILTKQNVSDTQKLSGVSAPSLTAGLDKTKSYMPPCGQDGYYKDFSATEHNIHFFKIDIN